MLNQPEYQQWSTVHHEAEVSLTNRDELLFQSYLTIEKKLELLGEDCIVCVRMCVCVFVQWVFVPCVYVQCPRVCVCVCV